MRPTTARTLKRLRERDMLAQRVANCAQRSWGSRAGAETGRAVDGVGCVDLVVLGRLYSLIT